MKGFNLFGYINEHYLKIIIVISLIGILACTIFCIWIINEFNLKLI